MKYSCKIDCFWFTYFIIRFFYLLFAILVFGRISTLGDTQRYLGAGINFTISIFYNSTSLMDCIGGLIGTLFGGTNIISNFPFMMISFWIVKWTINELNLRKFVNSSFLLVLISLPNFCIWTSVCSKEIFGLAFSAIFGVLLINFFNQKYQVRKRDFLALYLCLLFKPQYFPFILQALILVYVINEKFKTPEGKLGVGVFFIGCNLLGLYLMRDLVNEYADMMYIHFSLDSAESTRDNIWLQKDDFFRKAPLGMLEAFYGPTLSEMVMKPSHLVAGLESLFMIGLFIYLCRKIFFHFLVRAKVHAMFFSVYSIIIVGICFLHYPFGIFNPGSAIRYRTNFIFLFMLLFLNIYVFYKKKAQQN